VRENESRAVRPARRNAVRIVQTRVRRGAIKPAQPGKAVRSRAQNRARNRQYNVVIANRAARVYVHVLRPGIRRTPANGQVVLRAYALRVGGVA